MSGLLDRAAGAHCLLVLGHGAGAPMTHPFMERLAAALVAERVSALRYNFAYAEAGRRRPDVAGKLHAVAASALRLGRKLAEGAPLFAGGKSMGGRMSSSLIADRVGGAPGSASPLPALAGLVFFGFPLHPPGRPDTARADHLASVGLPMLFHQGTRDRLADIGLMRTVVAGLGAAAALREVDDAGHSFDLPKRSGRTTDEAIARMAEQTAIWTREVAADSSRLGRVRVAEVDDPKDCVGQPGRIRDRPPGAERPDDRAGQPGRTP